jgi:hypothetical protein
VRGPAGRKGPANVPPTLITRQARLAGHPSPSHHKWSDGQPPEKPELAGEALGRLVPAPQAAVAVGRDIRDDVCRRTGQSPDEKLGGQACERAGSALLPGADERTGGVGVGEPRAGGGESDPPPVALSAPLDRPGRRRATPGAERPMDRDQPAETPFAEGRPGLSAGDAARGDEEVDEPPRPR